MRGTTRRFAMMLSAAAVVTTAASGQLSFVNWESPHVSPLDITPDGSKLLAVNTADNRLEVFEITGGGLSALGSIPVGLDPVSVRARTDSEAWVVNHISDSISIVDLRSMNTVRTIYPGDEPADVVFAGKPQRAFVSVSQLNQVKVYDPTDPSAPPVVIDIAGEDPRALATDGSTVYAAIFESGNRTTIINEFRVSDPLLNPYRDDPNPPPNDGAEFSPPIAGDLPPPPAASMILEKDADAVWRDDNGADWSAAVFGDLHDHDVAIIDADSLSVTYATGAMNLNMALAVRPGGGATVVGTDAINEIRFEPNVRGIFARVIGANVNGPGESDAVVDLNPHLDYSVPTVGQGERDMSIGDPRGIDWNAAGDQGYITGMGSNNVVVVASNLSRVARIEVGEGPTGVFAQDAHDADDANERVYVLNKLEGSISIIDAIGLSETERVNFYDPTPDTITEGRPFLYDTHLTSGLGQASCASCHVDGRMDQIAWDLGDPQGEMKEFNQDCFKELFGIPCEDWHPMKGPMTTQTLVGIIGTEPFHWRGDRENFAAFNGAFEGLQGDDTQLTDDEMDRFVDFIATLVPPPNPYRNIDGSLPTSFFNGGNAAQGETLFNDGALDAPFNCVTCHPTPNGTDNRVTPRDLLEAQSFNSPHLINLYEKTGFDESRQDNNRGFGFAHDGSFDTLFNFFDVDFNFKNEQQKLDVEAYVMSFSEHSHAAVGLQATLPDMAAADQRATADELISLASGGMVALIAKGIVDGEKRGYYLLDGETFQSDRAEETIPIDALLDGAQVGQEITLTAVPVGTEIRIGVDRDEDGFFDRDELDAGSDPADPNDTPVDDCPADLDGDDSVGSTDLLVLLGAWGANPEHPADLDGDGVVGTADLLLLLGAWGPCG